MDRLVELSRSGEDDPDFGTVVGGRDLGPRRSELRKLAAAEARERGEELPARSPEVVTDNPVFVPPFVGSRVAKGMSVDDVATYLNETALFRNQWGFRPESGEDDPAFKERVRRLLREQLATAKAEQLLVPQVAWGHFAANADGDELVIFKDDSRSSELMRFSFPRQTEEPWLCISDFFRSVASGEPDWASFQVVTMGSRVSEEAARLFAEDEYQQYLYLHGLGVEMAEALAEYWHRRIREELGFAEEDGPTLTGLFRQKYRGGRYSWGYPACPNLEDNAKVVDLLGADRIGVVVSEGFQLHPEQSTTAIICHHPQAKYFVA
jgi:5-methyltetrahydrofolate--homocysteine methyltransferase